MSALVQQVAVVGVDDVLDHRSVPRTREQLHAALAARPERLVVDLSGCSFVDASALSMLVDVHRRACRGGGVLTLRGCSPRVLRLLSLTGLRRVFDVEAAA
jgi:anti-sigma B factor antagonist